jgi:hypothetical protein
VYTRIRSPALGDDGRGSCARRNAAVFALLHEYGHAFGGGFARLDRTIQGSTLSYRWRMASDNGAGRLTLQGGDYRGTWGMGSSATDGGPIVLRSSP